MTNRLVTLPALALALAAAASTPHALADNCAKSAVIIRNHLTWKSQIDERDFVAVADTIVDTVRSPDGKTITLITGGGAVIGIDFATRRLADELNVQIFVEKPNTGDKSADEAACLAVQGDAVVDVTACQVIGSRGSPADTLRWVDGKQVTRFDVALSCDALTTAAAVRVITRSEMDSSGPAEWVALGKAKLTRQCIVGETLPGAGCLKNP